MTYRPFAAIISEAQSSSSALTTELNNDSGDDIAALQPVCGDGSGKIKAIDVSEEADFLTTLGLPSAAIADGAYGDIVTQGRIPNVSTSFAFGDYLYVGKDGLLTNVLPEVGSGGFVDGDYSIRVGMIVRNRANPSQKDIIVQIERIGQM